MTKSVSEMTNEEFLDFALNQGLKGWIPLRTYLRLLPEETKSAIKMRIKRNQWQRGVHHNTPPGSNMWVNLHAIAKWASEQQDDVGRDQ